MKTKVSKKKLKKAKVAVDFEGAYKPTFQSCTGQGPKVQTLTAAEVENPHIFFWKTRDGKILRIADMQLDHLLNARTLVRRRIVRMNQVELAMTREIRKRTNSELQRYGEARSYEPIDEDFDPHPGQR
jgi:hypothetical protein